MSLKNSIRAALVTSMLGAGLVLTGCRDDPNVGDRGRTGANGTGVSGKSPATDGTGGAGAGPRAGTGTAGSTAPP